MDMLKKATGFTTQQCDTFLMCWAITRALVFAGAAISYWFLTH